MHTARRALAALSLTLVASCGTLIPVPAVAATSVTSVDLPACDPGDYYRLEVRVVDLEHQLARQAEQHADELDDLNDVLRDADRRATEQTNRHAEELAGVFRQLDEAQAATRKAEAEAYEELDERLDAERALVQAERRITRLRYRIAALKANR